ncbi:MAG TPA: hypothetical protein VF659_04325 [Pyrinomonadaceae bacterium]
MIYLIRLRKHGRPREVTLLPALRPPCYIIPVEQLEMPPEPAAPQYGQGTAAAVLDELREKALAASYDEYKELTGAWRNLDAKAQGNITVAGIFIAGVFTYLTAFPNLGVFEAIVLTVTILFLVACVIFSVLVFRVRKIPPHYLGDSMREMVGDLQEKTEGEFPEYLLRFYNAHARGWAKSSKKLIEKNENKGQRLWQAEVCLLIAILSAAVLVVFKLIFKFVT